MVSELNILSKDKLKKMGHPDRKKKNQKKFTVPTILLSCIQTIM